jgi:hypothetical protein
MELYNPMLAYMNDELYEYRCLCHRPVSPGYMCVRGHHRRL